MRRLFLALVLLFAFVSQALAAGTVTVTRHYSSQDGKVVVIKAACVGDVANGSIPNTLITAALVGQIQIPDTAQKWINDYTKAGYYLYEVKVVTGAVKPDAADVYLLESLSGNTIFSQANLIPTTGTAYGTVSAYRAILSGVSVVVLNQSTASATYDIYITLVR